VFLALKPTTTVSAHVSLSFSEVRGSDAVFPNPLTTTFRTLDYAFNSHRRLLQTATASFKAKEPTQKRGVAGDIIVGDFIVNVDSSNPTPGAKLYRLFLNPWLRAQSAFTA